MIDRDKLDEELAKINPESVQAVAHSIAKSKGMFDDLPDRFFESDSDCNEDGVPLDEYEAGSKWCGWLQPHGVYSVRIENIGLSMPDTLLVHKGLTVFNEMKVRRGNHIYAPMYQLPSYIRLAEHLRRWQMVYVVFSFGAFDLYEFHVIKQYDWQPTNSGKLKLDISEVPVLMTIRDSQQVTEYLEWIYERAFKKKTA